MEVKLSNALDANLAGTQRVINSPHELRSESILSKTLFSPHTRQSSFSNLPAACDTASHSPSWNTNFGIASELHQLPKQNSLNLPSPHSRRPIEPSISIPNAILPGPFFQSFYLSPSKLDAYHHVARSPSASPIRLAPAEAPVSSENTAPIRLPTLSPLRSTSSIPSIASVTNQLAMEEKQDSPFVKDGNPTPSHSHSATHSPQRDEVGTTDVTMNPYETDPEKIPKTDKFLLRHPHHGRYLPRDDDFIPDERHSRSTNPESLKYWEDVLTQCNLQTRINVPREGKRDIFALGSVIVKSNHLDATPGADFNLLDENEEMAVTKAKEVLPDIQLPETYLRSKIGGRDVLIQSRIAGTSLEVAWPYLTPEQKADFKEQARDILRRMCQLKWNDPSSPGYIVAGAHDQAQQNSGSQETSSLLNSDNRDLVVSHNDLVPSNIIVNNDKIVGIVGWANMGHFSWKVMNEVHMKQRCVDKTDTPVAELFESDVPWHDLYNITLEGLETKPKTAVKTEALTPTPEITPGLPTAVAPTPKNIVDLKRKSVSRAPSSERSSPIPPSSSQQPSKKRAPATTAAKKGTAKRNPPPKKRKLNDSTGTDDMATAVGGASTPASRQSKTPAQKRKQSSLSVTGSPAPGNRKANRKGNPNEMDVDDDDVDESEIFCVCRKPDNHTWMIGCDGGCEDWFHGKCMNLNQDDADLIDKYICPSCEKTCGMHTTWKPMCRYEGCRQPARVDRKVPSKYCSDAHGKDSIMRKIEIGTPQSDIHDTSPITPGQPLKTHPSSTVAGKGRPNPDNQERPGEDGSVDQEGQTPNDQEQNDDDGDAAMEHEGTEEYISSKGGVLTASELKAVASRVKSADEFRKLGESPLTPRQAELKTRLDATIAMPITSDENNIPAEDPIFKTEADKVEFSPEERQQLKDLRALKAKLDNHKDMLHDRERFLGVARQRAKLIFERLQNNGSLTGIQWKDVCGFDERFSWSDVEFDEWRKSDAGKKVLNSSTDNDQGGGDGITMKDAVNADTVENLAKDLCLKKRCERHKKWLATMQQDAVFEQGLLKEQHEKCQNDAEQVVKKAVLRVFGDED